MKNKPLLLAIATLLAFITLAPITGCTPKNEGDLIKHCDNQVKDEDETGIDCGGSCTPCIQPCDTIVCQNSGTCNNGNCNCPAGYTGNRCQTEVRQAYLGRYNISGTATDAGGAQNNISNISMVVSATAGNAAGLTLNLDGGTAIVSALLQSNNTSFTISPQAYTLYTYNGTGSFSVSGGVTTVTLNLTEKLTTNPADFTILSLTGPKQ